MRLDILRIAHTRIFVAQPDAMGENAVAKGAVFLGKPVRLCRHLGKTHSRLDQPDIGHHMLIGDLVEGFLLLGRGDVADNPASRDITAIAIGADKVGVEGHHVAFLHDPRAAFLEPRIGARARRQDAGLDPFAAPLDVAGMKRRPHLVLRHARTHRIAHFLDRHLAGMDGAAHGADLVVVLDGAGMLGQHLTLDDLDALLDQPHIAGGFDLVDGKTLVRAAVGLHHINHLVDEVGGCRLGLVAGLEVEEAGAVAHLADKRQMRGQMLAIVEIPQDHLALGRHEAGARRVVRDPQLHVGGVGGIADVQRIEQQQAGTVMLADLLLQPRQPVFAERRHVRRLDPGSLPFGEGKVGRTDLHPVVVVGCQVGFQMRAPGRVDPAVRANDCLVHHMPHKLAVLVKKPCCVFSNAASKFSMENTTCSHSPECGREPCLREFSFRTPEHRPGRFPRPCSPAHHAACRHRAPPRFSRARQPEP